MLHLREPILSIILVAVDVAEHEVQPRHARRRCHCMLQQLHGQDDATAEILVRERAVDVWTDPSATLLRIDPHVFNNASDLERLFDGLDEFRQTHGTTSLQRVI